MNDNTPKEVVPSAPSQDRMNAPGKPQSGQVDAAKRIDPNEPAVPGSKPVSAPNASAAVKPKPVPVQTVDWKEKRARAIREIAVIVVAVVAAVISAWQAQEARLARIHAEQDSAKAGNDAQRAARSLQKLEADMHSSAVAQEISAKTQAKTLDVTGRPYVVVEGITKPTEYYYNIEIKGGGTTPALRVRVQAGCVEKRGDLSKKPVEKMPLWEEGGQLLPNSELNVAFSCQNLVADEIILPIIKAHPAGASKTDDSEEEKETEKQTENETEELNHFFVVGRIQYEDIRKIRHYTKFCREVYVNPHPPLLVNTCLAGNESN